ncbi:MAG: hypothetical protein J5620_04150 [Alphaproteobacteria bacterium]|nr:hypothetical protein [Alphaproteobacteria bacterium]
MKKISNYFLAASVFVMASVPAFADEAVCKLITGLKPIINTLRTLAFIGAAFVLMDWAWGFIKKGEVKKDDLQDKGVGMLVGFFLLFSVGLILQFVGSKGGAEFFNCPVDFLGFK